MKQTIVALIRPNLNYAQKENQAAHLIEHILLSPKRAEKMGLTDEFYARNIIEHNGGVNDSYISEYFVVKSEATSEVAKMITKYQDDLFIDQEEFEKIKTVVIQEIVESKEEFISTGEQIARAIYKQGSPAIINPWNDIKSIKNISLDQTVAIFKNNNIDVALFELSFDEYKTTDIPKVPKNMLREDIKVIELAHPWVSLDSVDTTIIVPLENKLDPLINIVYRASLTDSRFGLLYKKIRNLHGLVYGISASIDYNNDSMDLDFSSDETKVKQILDIIKKALGEYDSYICKNLGFLKDQIEIQTNLNWGDVQNHDLWIIDDLIKGGFREPPKDLLKKLKEISAEDLIEFNNEVLNSALSKSILIKHKYGKKVETISVT